MSDEEQQLKPVEESTATAFDPKLVAINMVNAAQAEDDALQKKLPPVDANQRKSEPILQRSKSHQSKKSSEYEHTQRN
ncbi:hypothetical protein TELCIR_11881 [Teladorsagia circumcincta]|uniref:Uncharacterized protein n=1 Tax=Teladorsagia circumcincta TaxID=45464 RepID=A0A2G9U8A0_TELCI|nr:hypothetical protein TELCIR_11881 [Teladorsagia circumcincta]